MWVASTAAVVAALATAMEVIFIACNKFSYITAGVGAQGVVRIIWPGSIRQFPMQAVGAIGQESLV
jgi:hypothetical protein